MKLLFRLIGEVTSMVIHPRRRREIEPVTADDQVDARRGIAPPTHAAPIAHVPQCGGEAIGSSLPPPDRASGLKVGQGRRLLVGAVGHGFERH